MDNDMKRDSKELATGMFKKKAQERVNEENHTDSELYARTKGEEKDTGIKIPTEDSVEDAREWSEENRM